MSYEIDRVKVTIKLTNSLLGTIPKSRAVFSNFIANKFQEAMEHDLKKAQKTGEKVLFADGKEYTAEELEKRIEEEKASVQDIAERGWTGFLTDADGPFILPHMIRGFLDSAASAMKEYGQIKQLASKVKKGVFVVTSKIRLPKVDKTMEIDPGEFPQIIQTEYGPACERALRAATAQGPRVTVTKSDVVLAGAKLEFELHILRNTQMTPAIVRELLNYGRYQGLGQWRSGGWGSFEVIEYVLIDAKGNPIKESKKRGAKNSGELVAGTEDTEDVTAVDVD